MRSVQFQRARSEEQREARRQAILRTTAAMLADMPVSQLSLNELSRRVGLAKSNVLRYFESREAVLLELLDLEWRAFLDELTGRLVTGQDPEQALRIRYETVARAITEALVARPLLGELVSVSAGVLEHNVSTAVARRYKTAAIANTATLATLVRQALPELGETAAANFAAAAGVAAAGIWPLANPADSMLCVYEDPAFATVRIDLASALTEMLATLLAGCLSRWPGGAYSGES